MDKGMTNLYQPKNRNQTSFISTIDRIAEEEIKAINGVNLRAKYEISIKKLDQLDDPF